MANPIGWKRADAARLARFDPFTKVCVMNCGPHSDDPRSVAERRFLCEDCLNDWSNLEVDQLEQSQ